MLDLFARFDEYERVLLISPAITRFSVLKRRVVEREGYIRIRAELVEGGLFEVSEFWRETGNDETIWSEYSYHWQTADRQLVRRERKVGFQVVSPDAA